MASVSRLRQVLPLALLLLLLAAPVLGDEVHWTGVWDSRWQDGGAALYLEQEGEVVTGTYPVLEGELRGVARGRLLIGTWRDPAGAGELVFAMAPDGRSFMGRFGTGQWWTGRRVEAAGRSERVVADASSPRESLRSFVTAGNASRESRADRLGPALAVLDFSDLPVERTDTPVERLGLAARLFWILDQLTFRIGRIPAPAPDQRELQVRLTQDGTGEPFDLTFRYGVRADGAAGWFIVVPQPAVMDRALARLLRVFGGERDHPRAHEALRSPRDTIRTFLEQYHAWERTDDHRLLFSTLDVADDPLLDQLEETSFAAHYLKQVIDRVGFVVWQEIPNHPGRRSPYTHFVHPEGRVEIARVETEDGGHLWQFTRETLDAVRALYVAMEDMPLEPGVSLPTSSAFLTLRNEIRAFDRDLLDTIGGVELWQWLALAGVLLVSVPLSWLLAFLLIRVVLRWQREPGALLSIKARFVWPLQGLIIAGSALAALGTLGLPEHVDLPVRLLSHVVLTLIGGWLLYNLIDKLGALLWETTSGRFENRYEMLRSITVAVAKVMVFLGTVLVLADVLAIPYQGVLAGLGIGGVAVALAAQSTIANFIGGLTLLADKPVQVGDFCRFDGKLGTVEGLGLRSVKVRSLDRTVYAIPNAEFVNLPLENFTRRDHILLKTILQLRYETTPDQLRWVLAKIRGLLIQHPRVLRDPSRARFVGFGAHSLDIEIFAYVNTTDYNEYLSIQEDIFLRLIDCVEASGTSFAFPSSVTYLARDKGLDTDRQAEAEAAVDDWRERDRMPFPDFEEDERWGMFNTLDFPPTGSPYSRRALDRRQQHEEQG